MAGQGGSTRYVVASHLIHFSCTKTLENRLIVYQPPIIPGYGWWIILSTPPVWKKRLTFCISPCRLPSEHSHLFGFGMCPSVATPLILHLICILFSISLSSLLQLGWSLAAQTRVWPLKKELWQRNQGPRSYGKSLLLFASQVKKGKEGRSVGVAKKMENSHIHHACN